MPGRIAQSLLDRAEIVAELGQIRGGDELREVRELQAEVGIDVDDWAPVFLLCGELLNESVCRPKGVGWRQIVALHYADRNRC